jgi:hypothetical protein
MTFTKLLITGKNVGFVFIDWWWFITVMKNVPEGKGFGGFRKWAMAQMYQSGRYCKAPIKSIS